MERLTKRMSGISYLLCGNVILSKCENCHEKLCSCYEEDCGANIKALNKLAAYEDTGLTPAEIEAMKGKLAQAVELLELTVKHVPRTCTTCKHWFCGGNGVECANGGCTDTLRWELWEWQHADKLAELKGEL